MDAQLHRPTTHDQYEENPHHHSVIHEGELDHHGEKKSVLKKVKAKAKKLKDTIKHHGQTHDHHQHDLDDKDDDDDDDEMLDDDPEVHGAPMNDTTVIKGTNLPMQVDVNLEKPADPREDRGYPDSGSNELERPQHVTAQPHLAQTRETVPLNMRTETTAPLGHLQMDPDAPRSRHDHVPIPTYQSKVNDPAGQGGQEANVDPLIHKLENLDAGKSESKLGQEHRPCMGTHDQFTPETRSTVEQFKQSADTHTPSGHDDVEPKSVDPSYPDLTMAPQGTITEKISSATSAITEKAFSAKNVVASKLGYGPHEGVAASESSTKPVTETTGYGRAIADKLAPVYGKVAGAGTVVMAKVPGMGGSEYDTGSTEQQTPDKGVSVKEYLAEKFRPGDEDKALSEVISDAFQMKKVTAGEAQHHHVVGKVTESKEVRERLGTGKENRREGEDAMASGSDVVGSGQGVVDKLKGAVTSWLGKSTGIETAQESIANSHVSGTGSDACGGGRIGTDTSHN